MPILLGPPEGGGDARTNRIELSDKAKAKIAAQAEMAKRNDRADGRLDAGDAGDAVESEIGDGSVEEDGEEEEEEDEFAAMVSIALHRSSAWIVADSAVGRQYGGVILHLHSIPGV